MANPPITIGELGDVPAPKSRILSAWAQEVTNRVLHRFATPAARDSAWPAATAGVGATCITLDKRRVWQSDGIGWRLIAGNMPRFRIQGGGAGQTIAWNTNVNLTWAGGTKPIDTDGLVDSNGLFFPPAAFLGRWRIEYCIRFGNNGNGHRNSYMAYSADGQRYAQMQGAASPAFECIQTGSAELVVGATGQNVVCGVYQSSGINLAMNTTASDYFQGQYVGPV